MIDTLLFDLGNVLVRWDPRYHYRDRFASAAAMEAFLEEVCPPSWNHEMDLGKPFATAISERQARFPAHAALIAEWQSGWQRMLAGEIAEMVALLPLLAQAGYRLYALSNWSAETFPVARARYGWLSHFSHIVISGDVGLAKPDPAIFALALQHAGRPAADVLFIDDNLPNVEAARAMGLPVVHYTSPAQCQAALRQAGVQWTEPAVERR